MRDPRFAAWRARIDAALGAALPAPGAPGDARLNAAMRHACLLGGKRMRPLLAHATGHAFDADAAALDACGVAVELIHAYSLVHDDLPCMDDDALRRGQPTVHVAFDDATAVLAGDALQALAFEVLARAPLPAEARIDAVRELAVASGAQGMCGGQAQDVGATGNGSALDLEGLRTVHALKTGALIRASVRLGAIAGGADDDARARLDAFGAALGLAFQVRDDILDVEGHTAALGKTAGKDAAQDKATFPALIGIDASHRELADLRDAMHAALAGFDAARVAPLRELGDYAAQRGH